MSGGNERNDFSKDRAELFEALGHPTRIRMLQCLADAPLGFSELKRVLDIESSGLLQFHVGKLNGLVKSTPEGNYALTDEGREALRSIVANADVGNNHVARRINRKKTKILATALALSIIAVVALVGYAYHINAFYHFNAELDQVLFFDARISNITLYQNPSEGEGALAFSWQFYCRNPYGYPLGMTINDVEITVLVDIELPGQGGHMASFLIDSPMHQYTVAAEIHPESLALVSGTLFYNTPLGTANPIMEYLSANGIRINQFSIGAAFSNGAPFMSLYKGVSLNVSPDQDIR